MRERAGFLLGKEMQRRGVLAVAESGAEKNSESTCKP
jgi:hypothetical protein